MGMRKAMIILAAVSALASAGRPALSQESAGDGGPTASPPGAKVSFLDIKKDQKVPVGTVIHFGLSKMGVAPAGVEKQNTGHHHLLIDEAARRMPPLNELIPSDEQHIHFGNGQTDWEVDLEPGPHDLRLLVGDAGHVPHSPPVYSRTVRIVVIGKAGKAPAAATDGQAEQTAEVVRDCEECGDMVVVPTGKFRMGTKGRTSESPVRTVTVARSFAIARQPVTFADWQACIDDGGCGNYTPSDHDWGREDRPVIDVSWNDAKEYIRWLSEKSGRTYRLPTEAEWEYAARAGTSLPYWWGSDVGTGHANCKGCEEDAQKQTVSIATYRANPWGILDMVGNAAEWVEDCWHPSYQGAPSDASAWTRGDECSLRVLRGGYFDSNAEEVRTASRAKYDADVRFYGHGFRIARDAD